MIHTKFLEDWYYIHIWLSLEVINSM